MFSFGLLLMAISVMGLIGLAFMHARYPHALDSMMLPPEAQKAKVAPEGAIQTAMAPSAAEEAGEIDLGEFTVNSMSRAQVAPTPPSE